MHNWDLIKDPELEYVFSTKMRVSVFVCCCFAAAVCIVLKKPFFLCCTISYVSKSTPHHSCGFLNHLFRLIMSRFFIMFLRFPLLLINFFKWLVLLHENVIIPYFTDCSTSLSVCCVRSYDLYVQCIPFLLVFYVNFWWYLKRVLKDRKRLYSPITFLSKWIGLYCLLLRSYILILLSLCLLVSNQLYGFNTRPRV